MAVLTRLYRGLKGIAENQLCAQPSRQRRSFDSKSAERRGSVRLRISCAGFWGYANGIAFAMSAAVDILNCEGKIFSPSGVAIPFLQCGGAGFEE
jgi:hypothetical protein